MKENPPSKNGGEKKRQDGVEKCKFFSPLSAPLSLVIPALHQFLPPTNHYSVLFLSAFFLASTSPHPSPSPLPQPSQTYTTELLNYKHHNKFLSPSRQIATTMRMRMRVTMTTTTTRTTPTLSVPPRTTTIGTTTRSENDNDDDHRYLEELSENNRKTEKQTSNKTEENRKKTEKKNSFFFILTFKSHPLQKNISNHDFSKRTVLYTNSVYFIIFCYLLCQLFTALLLSAVNCILLIFSSSLSHQLMNTLFGPWTLFVQR